MAALTAGWRLAEQPQTALARTTRLTPPMQLWQPSATLTAMHDPEKSDDRPSPTAVQTLVDNHREFLHFLERRVGDRAQAEDILQDAFTRGVERFQTLRDGESVVAWFYRMLRNAVVDHYRRRGAGNRAMEAFANELGTAEEPSPEFRITVCSCVRTLADTLKPEYATALKRIDIDGMSVRDYAIESGIEANNAAVRVHRAREALRKRVAQSCGTCAEHGCFDCTCETGCH